MMFPNFLLLTSLLILASPNCFQPATSKPHSNFTDLESLLAFKSLADPTGILDANWSTNTTFCSWIGVQCSSRLQRVTVIRLRDFSLHGTISPHLGSLPSNNSIMLPRLRTISLAGNYFTGDITSSFSQCQDLHLLSLGGNNFSGAIPSEFEYATTGTLSRMSDVYSFGILLLETFTGKKPVDDMFNGESNLREWISKAHPNAIFNVVDYKLLEDHAEDDGPLQDQTIIHQCLMSIIELGLLCSVYVPKERIPMTDVAVRLRKIKVEYLSNLAN